MAQYLIGVDFQAGDDPAPMSDWTPEEVQAHLDYYGVLIGELEANGELVSSTILTGPDLAKIVRSDGVGAGRHRRTVPGVQGVAGRLPGRRGRLGGARPRDRVADVGRPGPRRVARPASRSTCGR